jgi:hypothetical protein
VKITIELEEDEAFRMIELENGMREAYKEIIRNIENVCTKYQIRYQDIYTQDHLKRT